MGVLAQLRNLDYKLKNVIDSIAKYFSEERDVLYLRGLDRGKETVVGNLLTQTDFDVEKIANIANVSIDFVKNIQEKQKNKS